MASASETGKFKVYSRWLKYGCMVYTNLVCIITESSLMNNRARDVFMSTSSDGRSFTPVLFEPLRRRIVSGMSVSRTDAVYASQTTTVMRVLPNELISKIFQIAVDSCELGHSKLSRRHMLSRILSLDSQLR